MTEPREGEIALPFDPAQGSADGSVWFIGRIRSPWTDRENCPKNMAAAGRLSGLLIQALRGLGQEHVTATRLKHLKRTLPAEKRKELLKDLPLAPAWMHPIFRELAEAGT